MSVFMVANRAGRNSGWSSSIWIIVGTITVIDEPNRSVTSSTAAGSNNGMNVDTPPQAGIPSTPPRDAEWNIGVWCRYTNDSSMWKIVAILYRSNISARWSSSTPLGSPVVPPVYIRIARSSSSGSPGTTGFPDPIRSS